MAETTITVEVDAETAEAYASVSESDRVRVRQLIRHGLRHITGHPSQLMSQVLNEIGSETNDVLAADRDFEEWDKQIESDLAAGKLDHLIAQAKANKAAGRYTDL
jgi:hypothetical protein